jgi:hypothetical protein
MRKVSGTMSKNAKGEDHLGYIGVYVKIILKWI